MGIGTTNPVTPVVTLPIPILPIDKTEEGRDEALKSVSSYLDRNKLAWRTARNPVYTFRVMRIAAHASRLWCALWVNPATGKSVIIVGRKAVLPSWEKFESVVNTSEVVQSLENWTK